MSPLPDDIGSTTGTRPLAGVAVGLGVLALVALPAVATAGFAFIDFTGFTDQSVPEPDPVGGALWAGTTVFLLALPVVAGLVAARVQRRGALLFAAICAAVLIAAWLLAQPVD